MIDRCSQTALLLMLISMHCLTVINPTAVLAQDDSRIVDSVRVKLDKKKPSDPDQYADRKGRIVEYNSYGIVLERNSGRQSTIKFSQIAAVHYAKTTHQKLAESKEQESDFQTALSAYRDAMKLEQRNWVQQSLMAGQVRCLLKLNQTGEAARLFGAMTRADLKSRYFHLIPLRWSESQPDAGLSAMAASWLASDEPVAKLMAASWMLNSPNRQEVIAVLEKLSAHRDPRIAHLASAQIWRTRFLAADGAELNRWTTQIQRMPKMLRAGPSFVLARALIQNQRYQDGAALMMKVMINYQPDDDLNAAALYRAGQALAKANSNLEAMKVFKELVRNHPNSEQAQLALQQMNTIQNKK